ncbi:type II toxin-antitoxin system HipA family toxin [Pseudovibrio sp. Tun.PSC04-5.I4]|uniref:type II toxin-antitoxin system HipA family toxin n=1 Tax=Pseudovibrio sp. Tun.PSC04-5.I4 TaxID=1798213 RepID=UPI000882A783|nr:type II toxin-antitoxin system HipA family toxin [Pseudovibrio sp. Tun.PSC04-5.I4]SDQ32386.1 serine/threonine-protein kinase HipA [Pseudovibrio sp. Tun.PSC04-5.I4]
MADETTDAAVNLWGRQVAAVSWRNEDGFATFQYDPEFADSGIELSPLVMPLTPDPYTFPALPKSTFKGLPGLLADALPDKFGDRLINTWLATQERTPESFNPVERLCYVGSRAMGALEFKPTIASNVGKAGKVDVASLTKLANMVLSEKEALDGTLTGENDLKVINDILRVGTSAGGARAKAILAWNRETGEFRHGQIDAGAGFEHWLLKFDGIENNIDKEEPDSQGFGLIEYAYSKMATEAGIEMAECRIHREGGRSHFMTRRFDRTIENDGENDKLHMQSLCALQHYDFNDPNGYSYEQAVLTIRSLGLGAPALGQQFLRTVFNIIARNQDDHVKNIAFLMNRSGDWVLSPAYDMTYSYNPSGAWTNRHQMSVNGKRDNFTQQDLLAFAEVAGVKQTKARALIARVEAAVSKWSSIAGQVGIPDQVARSIGLAHRTGLLDG